MHFQIVRTMLFHHAHPCSLPDGFKECFFTHVHNLLRVAFEGFTGAHILKLILPASSVDRRSTPRSTTPCEPKFLAMCSASATNARQVGTQQQVSNSPFHPRPA